MNRSLLFIFTLFAFNNALACQFDDVTFDSDFSMARLDSCEKLDTHQYHIGIHPENEPVNPSPWYSFKVHSKQDATVRLKMTFNGNYPRYFPKISYDGVHWQGIPFSTENKAMWFSINTSQKPLWVSAQEVINNAEYEVWLNKMSALTANAKLELLGNSEQGRPINALVQQTPGNHEWLVVIGRQHPPEVTGAMALFGFSEAILTDKALQQRFSQRFNLLLVPDVNPDGVEQGNWRHNANGVDLNRDWKKFAQAETRLVRDKLASIVKAGGKIVFAVDFHSTYHDVFYTMPEDYPIAPKNLMNDWLAGLANNTKWAFKANVKPGSNPDNGVFKQFIADQYQVHAVTYEVGDNTNRQLIPYVAQQAARVLVDKLLATGEKDFNLKP
ncbi:M14 family metallopeptidase [Neptunicella sp. SCSIO 80796]|uniref:M14 family metallopeptidase n=1 Tax=Neptunicella plasticusilytica TaxID=3117012 RepID=UPI003A4DE4AC